MQPNHYDLLGQVQPDEPRRTTRDAHHQNPLQSRSPSGVAPTRSEDSWIEVSSQPSSSSLSSAATNDDIITTGLRVAQNGPRAYHHRSRRRRLQHLAAITTAQVDYSSREQSSSQDEYEESESESDRVLTSSNEDMARRSLRAPLATRSGLPVTSEGPSSDYEDDASTALGARYSSSPFVPQPNVFSHPPASRDPAWTRPIERHWTQPSEGSNCSRQTAIRRNSQASTRTTRRQSQQHSPYNMISPSYQADHDAALRSSLSTLLSCAAAARGLSKPDSQTSPPSGPSRAQPSAFRLVSESVAMGEETTEEVPTTEARRPMSYSPPTAPYSAQPAPGPKVKRRSSLSKDRHSSASRKARRPSIPDSAASPTIMTWVISAGVVVLFSAISFSAGYVIGREVGRMEASTGMGSVIGDGNFSGGRTSAACGQEAIKGGLKRFRWGTGAAASGVVA
ncbi:hypothetical protein BDV25DRAFT_133891 [Aspergillus avenaceus]|uniref:Uncharacterized protein n=1 Tax=Aspergillus avenaceus TaxID=36643 RepID=A0A5N6TGG8_ASPAV|nr:hypothetical protein BDV25DRAFT_133891 [Aspergillus avenaceus]